jgi:hypothetical protein
MVTLMQQLGAMPARFDRTRIVLETLSQDSSESFAASQRIARSDDPAVTIVQRLPATQGQGYVVNHHGQTLTLALRGDYTAGQTVRLAVAPAIPESAPGSQTATAAGAPPTAVTLGAEARLIGAILSRGANIPAGAPLQLATNAATSANPPGPEALKQALTESGVFYESHVVEWVQGERTMAELRREPQASFDAITQSTAAPAGSESAGIPDALVPVVKEQLNAIDSRQIAWRGEIWPQQTIELTIAEQESEGHGGHEEGTPAAWTTSMKLELPSLGGLRAVLQMQGDSLRLGLRASAESTSTLRDNGTELAASFAALGLKLVSMRVEEHGAQPA